MICWSEENGDGMRIHLLMKPKGGFTSRLAACALRPGRSIVTWVDGPYGSLPCELDDYGTVIMVADGTGISTQVLAARHLSMSEQTRTRKVAIFWLLDTEGLYLSPAELTLMLSRGVRHTGSGNGQSHPSGFGVRV